MGESTSSSQGVTFDLQAQSGVMQALYAVRTSDLGADEKNALRDQVFTYTKSGGDERLREQIETKLTELPLAQAFLDVYRAKAKTPAKPGFATGRRAPSFSVPSAPQKTETASKPTPKPSKAAPQPQPKTPPAQPEPVPTPKPKPKPEPAPTPDTEPTVAASADAYSIERIREIKRYINNKIGNPVNLVDIDNELGRSYMSALLAAMQSVNAETGRAGASEMQELEQIFKQVQPLLQDGASAASTAVATDTTPEPTKTAPQPKTPPAQPARTSESTTASNPELTLSPEPTTASTAAPTPSPAPQPAASEPLVSEAPTAPQTPTTPATPAPEPEPASNPGQVTGAVTPVSDQSVPEPQSSPASPTPEPSAAAGSVKSVTSLGEKVGRTQKPETHTPMPAVDADGEDADEDVAAVPMPTESAAPPKPARPPLGIGEVPAKSVSRDEAPTNLPGTASQPASRSNYSVEGEVANNLANQLTELDKKAAAANENHGNPLHAPEVDAGLEQLLQEWNLFKASGLFGTGPNGREHPLYKKIAPMMIQDVAQGRFDDARPEVTQSITDYMNGWRYEQGIVYEPGETFETYLRRVIRFIIDSKK